MNQHYLEQWSAIAKQVQKPFQAMLELNVKTLQGIKFLKAEELATIRAPEEFIEKQVNLAIENSHKALDYIKKSFEIFEQALLPLTESIEKSAKSSGEKTTLFDPTKAMSDVTKTWLDPLMTTTGSRRALEIANSMFDTTRAAIGLSKTKIKPASRAKH